MMGDLLYIDGVAVDLGEGVDITLNYKSNLLTELDKIVGNNSYTIKLPKTARNLGIIGNSDIPAGVGQYPRVTHEARYFRNGVEVIPSGSAVLLGVGDSIEVVLTWGATSSFAALVDEGKSLNEYEGIEDYIPWSKNSTAFPYTGNDEILFSDIKMGLTGESELAALHPCVRSTYVFNLLYRVYGLKLEFPEEKQAFINSLIIPLLTREGGYVNRISNLAYVSEGILDGVKFSINVIGESYASYFEAQGFTGMVRPIFKVKKGGRLVINPSFRSVYLGAQVQHGTDSILENTVYLPYTVDSVGFYYYNSPVEIDLAEDDYFSLAFPMVYEATGVNNVLYQFGMQPTELSVGERFPIVENLPDIDAVDFLKAISSMVGGFPVAHDEGNTIKFVSFDTLNDRSRAVDWTEKLLPSGWDAATKSISYALNDFAQHNRMLWKEDDTVSLWANGDIKVSDKTLEYERDAIELPFAPTDTVLGKATIPLYTYNDDGEPELEDVEPRILVEENKGGISTGTFNGLHWSTLISIHYRSFQNIVRRPVVIVENVYLNEFDLRDLDMTRSVYLGQYGRYYAVVEVKAPRTGVCECKLLQLDI